MQAAEGADEGGKAHRLLDPAKEADRGLALTPTIHWCTDPAMSLKPPRPQIMRHRVFLPPLTRDPNRAEETDVAEAVAAGKLTRCPPRRPRQDQRSSRVKRRVEF
jgi:hypothetical protein